MAKKEEKTIYQMFTEGTGEAAAPAQSRVNPLLAAMEEEKKKEAADAKRRALLLAAKPRKVMICGDAHGEFAKLFSIVETQDKKAGPFDAIFCVGCFFPSAGSIVDSTKEYLQGEKKAPRDCYFIDTGAVLLQAAPQGRTLNGNLHFLGAYGVREVCGLRVAFLSGHYDAAIYHSSDVDYVGGAFTVKAVKALQRMVAEDSQKRGVDVLLTSGWPAGIDQGIEDAAQRPPEVAEHSWQAVSAAPLAELCASIEPRYHIFGSADIFYQRPAFQAPHRGHTCRCIGLGQVGSKAKQRWIHALGLSPMASMSREDLVKAPPIVTDCPFSSDMQPAVVEKKDSPAVVDNGQVLEEAMSCLLAGDLDQFCKLSEKLRDSPFVVDARVEPAGTAA